MLVKTHNQAHLHNYYITGQDRRDRYSKGLIITLQSKPTTTYFWLRTQSFFIDGQIGPFTSVGVDAVPYVWLPKPENY